MRQKRESLGPNKANEDRAKGCDARSQRAISPFSSCERGANPNPPIPLLHPFSRVVVLFVTKEVCLRFKWRKPPFPLDIDAFSLSLFPFSPLPPPFFPYPFVFR